MTDNRLRVSVVIPAYNEEQHIGACLVGVTSQDLAPEELEVLVVDNGSTDRTVEIAKAFGVSTCSVTGVRVGGVRNFGAQNATGDILAFIDADCVPPVSWLSDALRTFDREGHDLVLGGGCKLRSDPTWIERYWLLERDGQPTLPKELIGAAIIIPRKIFDRVHGFPEDVTSGEDTEFSRKLRAHGIEVRIAAEYSVVHLGNATSAKAFIKRQIWHSENYIRKIGASLRDPTFVLVLMFITLVTGAVGSTFTGHFVPEAMGLLLLAALVPAIFTVKRCVRAHWIVQSWREVFRIYVVDTLYVIGRSVGLLKGLGKLALSVLRSS